VTLLSFYKTLAFFILYFYVAYSSAQQPIKIAVFKYQAPYSFVDQQGVPKGMLVDYWGLWGRQVNRDIEFVVTDYGEAIAGISTNAIDILPAVYHDDKIQQLLLYSDDFFQTTGHLYIKKHLVNEIKGLSDLNNRDVAVSKDSPFDHDLRQHYPKINRRAFPDRLKLVSPSVQNNVDIMFGDALKIWLDLVTTGYFGDFVQVRGVNPQYSVHAGVSANRNELLALVNRGIAQITLAQEVKIQQQWIIDKQLFAQVAKLDVGTQLNSEEQNWLRKEKLLQVGLIPDWFPYSFVDQSNELRGYHVDLIKMINHNLKINLQISRFDVWNSGLEAVKTGDLDALMGVSWTPLRSKLLNFSPVYLYEKSDIITHKDNIDISQVSDLNHKTVISLKGQIIDQYLDANLTSFNKVYVETTSEALNLIKSGKADAVILGGGRGIIANMPQFKVVKRLFTKGGEFSIATNKQQQILSGIMTKGVNSLSAKQRLELRERWIAEPRKTSLFNRHEQYFIRQHPKLIIGFDKNSSLIDGEYLRDKMRKIAELANIEFGFESMSKSQLEAALVKKTIDLVPTLLTSERGWGIITPNLDTFLFEVIGNKGHRAVNDIEQLADNRIAVPHSLMEYSDHIPWLANNKMRPAGDFLQSIELIETQEVEFVLIDKDQRKKTPRYSQSNISSFGQFELNLHLKTLASRTLLQRVINKSINHIKEQKNTVQQQLQHDSLKLTMGFIRRSQPYFFEDGIAKGIEHDLVKAVLNIDGNIELKALNFDSEQLEQAFSDDPTIDAIVGVPQDNDNYFYSENFIAFQDMVVTRQSDNLLVEGIGSLKQLSVGAWHQAYRYLGDDYYAMFSPDSNHRQYKEYKEQYQQVYDFINYKTDAIIIDDRIFTWFLNELAPSQQQFNYDYIFPRNNDYHVAFKERDKRDLFDSKLAILKRSGHYQQIISDYSKGTVWAKNALSQFIAAILSHALAIDDSERINSLLKLLVSLDYIQYIEVTSQQDGVFVAGNLVENLRVKQANSYYSSDQGIELVGRISVMYDFSQMEKISDNKDFIPSLNMFRHQADYRFIEQEYKRFGYLNRLIDFTEQESRYIAAASPLIYSNVVRAPLMLADGDIQVGMIPDYFKLISEKSGLDFVIEPASSFVQLYQKFDNNIVDIIPSRGEFNGSHTLESNSFVQYSFAIVSRESGDYVNKIEDIKKDKIAVVDGYAASAYIQENFPSVQLTVAPTHYHAFTLLSNNEVDYVVGHELVVRHTIAEKFPGLKIVGLSQAVRDHRLLVHADHEILKSVLDKVAASISFEEHQNIRNNWIRQQGRIVNYSLVFRIVAWFCVILVILALFYRQLIKGRNAITQTNIKLNASVNDLTQVRDTLTKKTKQLRLQKENFESLFNDASFNLCLLSNGDIIDCNHCLINFFGYQDKSDMLLLSMVSLCPKYQLNGDSTAGYIDSFERECMSVGKAQFECIFLHKLGHQLLCEVILTRISLDGFQHLHVLVSDIGEKKRLELKILSRNQALESTNKELNDSIELISKTQKQLIEAEKFAGLGALVAGVAHEINTPVGIGLTGITHLQGITNTLNEKYSSQSMSKNDFETFLRQSSEATDLIFKNLERTADLVTSFKQVSVDQTSEQQREFEINEYINEILLSLSSVLKRTQISINIVGPKTALIYSYPGLLSQILSNLVLNSNIHAFAQQQPGIITISFDIKQQQLELCYRDDGRGIDKDILPKIFEPFFTTNRNDGGSGLGLNIIHNIITKQLKGSISVDSDLGQGVEFMISYPVKVVDASDS